MTKVTAQKLAVRFSLGLSLAVAAAASASAHHSGAMFDPTKTVTLKGTVKSLQWSNPHAYIYIVRDAEAGGPASDVWAVELTSPGNLTRMGWSKHTVNPGDKVTIDIRPLRSGAHAGIIRKLTLANGTVVSNDRAATYRPGLQ